MMFLGISRSDLQKIVKKGGATNLIISRPAPSGSVRRRTDPCGVRPVSLMNPCGAARTNPHGCRTDAARTSHARRTDKIGRTDVRAAPDGRRTDTLPLPHGQFANLITITTTKTPHGQLVNLITITTRDNNMSVRRPCGAARTSVRPHG